MRIITKEPLYTTDFLTKQRYLTGIETGYPRLYREMKGMHSVLIYTTLQEAISGAEIAESALAVVKIQSSASSSSASQTGSWRDGKKSPSTQIDNYNAEGYLLENDTTVDDTDTGSGKEGIPHSKSNPQHRQVNSFVYRLSPDDGRY
jgi:hypothetical protein